MGRPAKKKQTRYSISDDLTCNAHRTLHGTRERFDARRKSCPTNVTCTGWTGIGGRGEGGGGGEREREREGWGWMGMVYG